MADIKTNEVLPDQIPIRSLIKINPQIGITDNFDNDMAKDGINVVLEPQNKTRYVGTRYQSLYRVPLHGRRSTVWI